MLRLTRRSEYGVMALTYLAQRPGVYCSVRHITECLQIPRRLLAEILKDLGKARIVEATRGPGGGYRLRNDPRDLTLASLVEALEGPCLFSYCSGGGECDMEAVCIIRGGMGRVTRELRRVLDGVTLQDLADQSRAEAERMRREAAAGEADQDPGDAAGEVRPARSA